MRRLHYTNIEKLLLGRHRKCGDVLLEEGIIAESRTVVEAEQVPIRYQLR